MAARGQLHTLAALLQGKSSCYPLDKLRGNSGEEKNSFPHQE